MVAVVKQRVTVQPGGLVEVRSDELRAGDEAEVIVLVEARGATSPESHATARERLDRFAGCVDSGDPRSGDNDRIDADLARQYLADNEPRT